MDILDVLVMAAGRISGLEKDHKMQEVRRIYASYLMKFRIFRSF